jgi:2-C-methyl-D-erythritol 4-phosphate cytidylyltransferase
MKVAAIVLAAGAGRRIGGGPPKTYLPIAGRPLVLRTLDRLFSSQTIEEVVLVVASDEIERCGALLRADSALRDRSYLLQTGGATRQESSKRGLEKIAADADIVLIHDGARPFVSTELIDRCAKVAADRGAVVVGLPVRDTIKVVAKDRWVESTPDRSSLWEIQTPQAFHKDIIVAAHDWAMRNGVEATDDALVVERMGRRVFVIDGEWTNLKITVPEDVWLAETLLREGRLT